MYHGQVVEVCKQGFTELQSGGTLVFNTTNISPRSFGQALKSMMSHVIFICPIPPPSLIPVAILFSFHFLFFLSLCMSCFASSATCGLPPTYIHTHTCPRYSLSFSLYLYHRGFCGAVSLHTPGYSPCTDNSHPKNVRNIRQIQGPFFFYFFFSFMFRFVCVNL
jgi:hypothetical protein